MYFIPNPEVSKYVNQDEVVPGQPAFDFTLVNANTSQVELIGKQESRVWELLQKHPNLADLIAVYSLETGKWEGQFTSKLLSHWQSIGYVHASGVRYSVPPKPWWQKLIWIELGIKNFDKYIGLAYKYLLSGIASTLGIAAILGIITSGIFLLITSLATNQIQLFTQISWPSFVTLILASLISLSIHELGHAIAMRWAQAPIIRAGIALYLGLPVFYVDTSTVWAKQKRYRIITAAAGILANLLIIAVCAWGANLITFNYWQSMLWEVALMNLIMVALSSIPFVKLDMYYILMDLTGTPNLGSLAYSRLKKLITKPVTFAYSLQNLSLVIFALLSGIGSFLLLIYSVLYWLRLISAFVRFVV